MFNPDAWSRKLTGADCPVCAAPIDSTHPRRLLTLPSGPVLLRPDGDFPGYCILYFRRHVAEIHDLTPAERSQLFEDLSRLARALAACCRPAKLNYACLGNEVPHLHWHVVPRYPADGWWGRSFSLRPESETRPLPEAEYARLRDSLLAWLSANP